jgi:hypothetical protein
VTYDAVPSDEMRWPAAKTDPIDAVLDDAVVDDDLLDVAAVVHDIRAAYRPATSLRRSEALAAFTDAHLDADHDPASRKRAARRDGEVLGAVSVARHNERRRRTRTTMLSTLSGFLGTLTGKALLGTAVAAASVGGLHAADVVDLPVLPAHDSHAADSPADGADERAGAASGTPDDDARVAGQMTATEKHAAAEAHAEAVREWTDCVADAAAANGDEAGTDGPFDPRAACGDMPTPGDFGLTDIPVQAADAARAAASDAPAGPGARGATEPTDGGAGTASPRGAQTEQPTSGTAPMQPGAVPGDSRSADGASGGPSGAPAETPGERP